MNLAGKVILVTGAGSGIGRGVAQRCASLGAKVVVADKSAEAGLETTAMLEATSHQALFVKVDVSSEPEVENLIAQTLAHFGRLDGLVSNAGIGARKLGDGPLHQCTLEAWETVMAVNLRGTFLVCKHAIPPLLETRGAIVTMSSVLGMVGTQGLFDTHAYSTSKAAVIGLTRSIAVHYAKDGLRANCLTPGLIDTAMAARTKSDLDLAQQVAFWQPLKPLGEVQDLTEITVFLLSGAAGFITGATIPVDGGWSAQ
jgi:NAD(P)-dependent dehydrogenase (short-subunit alcohol dehydrogenase family)